jgi:hypothetical protein
MAGAEYYKDKYDAANSKKLDTFMKLQKYQEEFATMKNQQTKTAANKLDQIERTEEALFLQEKICDALKRDIDKVDISEGCKTHLLDVWIGNEFNRPTKDIRSKYIEKGIQMEEAGLVAYGIVKGWIPEKCTERKDDGFIMGEIDFWKDDTIYDNKSSWSIWTFFKNIKYLESPKSCPYYWQAQGYMKLWNKPKAVIVYTLLDTPEKLINNEKEYFRKDFVGSDKDLEDALQEIEKNLTYSDIPIDRRIIEVPIERSEEDIEKISKVVKSCRTYLNGLNNIIYEQEMDKEAG